MSLVFFYSYVDSIFCGIMVGYPAPVFCWHLAEAAAFIHSFIHPLLACKLTVVCELIATHCPLAQPI